VSVISFAIDDKDDPSSMRRGRAG